VAMAVDGGRWPKVVKEPRGTKDKGDGSKRQENGSMDLYARFHPLFILPCKRQPIGRGALCPHHTLLILKR
jgi:hypothetical protein